MKYFLLCQSYHDDSFDLYKSDVTAICCTKVDLHTITFQSLFYDIFEQCGSFIFWLNVYHMRRIAYTLIFFYCIFVGRGRGMRGQLSGVCSLIFWVPGIELRF